MPQERWGETGTSLGVLEVCPKQCLERLPEEIGPSQGPGMKGRWSGEGVEWSGDRGLIGNSD